MELLQRIFYAKSDFEGMPMYVLLRIGRVIGAQTTVEDTRSEIIKKLCTTLGIKDIL